LIRVSGGRASTGIHIPSCRVLLSCNLHFVPDQSAQAIEVSGQLVSCSGMICQDVIPADWRAREAPGQRITACRSARSWVGLIRGAGSLIRAGLRRSSSAWSTRGACVRRILIWRWRSLFRRSLCRIRIRFRLTRLRGAWRSLRICLCLVIARRCAARRWVLGRDPEGRKQQHRKQSCFRFHTVHTSEKFRGNG